MSYWNSIRHRYDTLSYYINFASNLFNNSVIFNHAQPLYGDLPWMLAVYQTLLEKKRLVKVTKSQMSLGKRNNSFKLPHDKTNKVTLHPAKPQISLGICPVWSESSLCAQWVAKDPSFLHADREDFDQTGRMPSLIWVFAGCTVILLVLLWGDSFVLGLLSWLIETPPEYSHIIYFHL